MTSMEVETNLHFPLDESVLKKVCKEASRSFFSVFGLLSHQINSYNDFVDNGIQKLFDSIGEIHVEPSESDEDGEARGELRSATVKFGKVTLEKPMFWTGGEKDVGLKFLPKHARLQHMSYSSPIRVKVEHKVYSLEKVKSDKLKTGKDQVTDKKLISEGQTEVVVGRLPVMVGSNLCWMRGSNNVDCDFDHGGYFLIKGVEKIFVAQEQICLMRVWVSDKPNWNVIYRADAKRIRVDIEELRRPRHEHLEARKVLNVQFLSCVIPLWVLLFALGMPSDKEIIEMLDVNMNNTRLVNLLTSTMEYADDHFEGFRRGGNALKEIGDLMRKSKFPMKENAKDCMDKYLFPGFDISLRHKGMFVLYMVKSLLKAYSGERKCENWDDFRNRRLHLASELLERELQNHINHTEKRLVKNMQRDLYGNRVLHPIDHYVDASIITYGLSRAFSTGMWSHHYKPERVAGVVSTLRRTNPLQTMSDLRKTRHQVQYAGNVRGARYPHPSHRGRFCFLSTPDGPSCGLVKNIAVTGLVSINSERPSLQMLIECGMEILQEKPSHLSLKGKTYIFLNGKWVGVCCNSHSFVLALKSKRRMKEVSWQVEIKWDKQQGEIRIFSDSGRVMRPLLVVENLKKLKLLKGGYNFNNLLKEGIVELVGIEEEEDCDIAMGIKRLLQRNQGYTHCELDPSFMLGLSCGIIPFPNHDHCRRALYQSEKHSQHAIGFTTTNPIIRLDTLTQQLYYPQRPLFNTMISDSLGKHKHSKPELHNGQNAIISVNVHHGYNQEDSVVMNRASIERGMFRTEHVRYYKADVYNTDYYAAKRLRPKDKIDFAKKESKFGCVRSLDDDGFPLIGAELKTGDIVIGKFAESGKNHSIKLKHTEGGVVQNVVLSANDEGTNFAAVSLRQVRSVSIGDKFSSMHGQKGVIGYLESQENLPFTRQGIVPDVVINPHAFPSRQTTGQLLETALGKGIACGGPIKYATPFTTPSLDSITEQLHRAGYSKWGSEKMCSGNYGDMMESLIFIGPTFYQRLTKMAEDAVKYRNTGPLNPYTRQPVKDRKRFGGIKFGEMERDCFLAYGAAANMHERLLSMSDASPTLICNKCSDFTHIQTEVHGGDKSRGPYCRLCRSAANIVKVNMPYGAKLLSEELLSMGVFLKIRTEP